MLCHVFYQSIFIIQFWDAILSHGESELLDDTDDVFKHGICTRMDSPRSSEKTPRSRGAGGVWIWGIYGESVSSIFHPISDFCWLYAQLAHRSPGADKVLCGTCWQVGTDWSICRWQRARSCTFEPCLGSVAILATGHPLAISQGLMEWHRAGVWTWRGCLPPLGSETEMQWWGQREGSWPLRFSSCFPRIFSRQLGISQVVSKEKPAQFCSKTQPLFFTDLTAAWSPQVLVKQAHTVAMYGKDLCYGWVSRPVNDEDWMQTSVF